MKESLEVLARKYRPSNFDELVGQESVAQTLSLALDSNRLSHAYLFSGLRGSGKTSTARIFAKALICEEGISHKPCGVCENCLMASQNRHIDIIEMDGASSRKIDDIRDLVEQTKYKPTVARFKVFIIDEVHMLTKEAFNALLKTLEEPPAYVKFILATTDPLKLPATILSRTQHFRFKSISTAKIVAHLVHILNLENINYDDEALKILARSGAGSLRDTLTLLDQAIIYSKGNINIQTVTDMLGLVDPKFLDNIFEAVFEKDQNKIINFIKELEDYESEMVLDEIITYLKEKMFNQDAKFSTLVLDRFFRILSESKYLFSINADGSFVLSLVFFKMIEAMKIKEIDQMIESLQSQVQTTTPKPMLSTNIPKPPQQEKELVVEKKVEPFEQLIKNIKDVNYELGNCFEKNVTFVSFTDNTLSWESCANEKDKQVLKYGFGIIKQMVGRTFNTKTIKMLPCSKQKEEPSQKEEKLPKEETTQKEIEQEPVVDSCVANCLDMNQTDIRITPEVCHNHPLIQKTTELFEIENAVITN